MCLHAISRQDASAAAQDLPVGPVPLAIFRFFTGADHGVVADHVCLRSEQCSKP